MPHVKKKNSLSNLSIFFQSAMILMNSCDCRNKQFVPENLLPEHQRTPGFCTECFVLSQTLAGELADATMSRTLCLIINSYELWSKVTSIYLEHEYQINLGL